MSDHGRRLRTTPIFPWREARMDSPSISQASRVGTSPYENVPSRELCAPPDASSVGALAHGTPGDSSSETGQANTKQKQFLPRLTSSSSS